jgi:hypothetical protein
MGKSIPTSSYAARGRSCERRSIRQCHPELTFRRTGAQLGVALAIANTLMLKVDFPTPPGVPQRDTDTLPYISLDDLKDTGTSDPQPKRAARRVPGLILTAVVLSCCLVVTVFSDLPSLRLFGWLSALAMLLALVADLTILRPRSRFYVYTPTVGYEDVARGTKPWSGRSDLQSCRRHRRFGLPGRRYGPAFARPC